MKIRIEELSSVLISLQESSESREKSFGIEIRSLERRLEECVTVSAAYVSTIQNRNTELEKSMQDREEKMRLRHKDLEDQLMKGLRENNEIASVERAELNRRMVLAENLVKNIAEKVDMSKNVFEGFFSNSPDVKRFQSAASKLEGLLVEFTSLRYLNYKYKYHFFFLLIFNLFLIEEMSEKILQQLIKFNQ